MASVAAVKTLECENEMKKERSFMPQAMPMDTNNHTGLEGVDKPANRSSDFSANQQSRVRSGRHSFPSAKQHQLQPGSANNSTTAATAAAAGSADYSGRRKSEDMLRSLISPEFPSQTGTPTSLSQLMPNFGSSEGNEFATPMGSGRLSPQTTDRLTRKRALSNSPLSSSSIDLNSLIRTSPTSLVNYITNSRGSSAGSFGHLSPSLMLYGNIAAHQQPHSRPIQVSLRSGNFPVTNVASNHRQQAFTSQQNREFAAEGEGDIAVVKREVETSPPSCSNNGCSSAQQHNNVTSLKMEDIHNSLFEGCNNVNVKMEPDMQDGSSFLPPPLIPLGGGGGGGLETVQEEPGGMLMSEDEDLMHSDPMHSDPTAYSAMMNSNECEEYETKLGIIESAGDTDRQKRIYYSYPSVEEPHNNQCRWAACEAQCDNLDGLVQHVNTDHIYRDSKKEFVCHWLGCVRERKPFKAQYMLLVHMRRHTGEKPHKCTYKGCFKAYSRLENLKTHLRSHTGERPYVCKHEGCGKAFSNASDCAKHMNRTHSDEKPYACPNPGCSKRYTDPSSRRKHMKNCQIKKPRKDNPDAMSGGEEDNTVESTAPKLSVDTKKRKQPKKSLEKRKPGPSSSNLGMRLSGDNGYGSGGSQAGYVSGGSQGYNAASQISYNSSGYDESDYCRQADEISNILQAQRLSDPTEMAGRGNGHGGHMRWDGRGSGPNHAHIVSQQGSYHFQSPPFQPSPLSPSQHHLMPPPLIPSSSSSRQFLPGEMTAPNNAHHATDLMASMGRSRQNHTPSSGYSSFRSSEKSPDDIDASSVVSSSIRTLSTFSSNSSRVSTPCSGGDRTGSLFPPANQLLGAGGPGQRGGGGGELDAYPHQQHSLRANNSYPTGNHHARRHSDEMSNSSRGWTTYSSQSSRYSYSTGSELSDDLLDNLPTDVRKNGFSKSEPLPLPESMQHNFSGGMGMEFADQGMEFGQGFMEHSGSSTMPLRHYGSSDIAHGSFSASQHSHAGDGRGGMVFSQDSSHSGAGDGHGGVVFSQDLSGSGAGDGRGGVIFSQDSTHSGDGHGGVVFSQDSSHLSDGGAGVERYEAYINMVHHLSSPGSSIVSPGNNMVIGNMDTFTQTLSEETQYYENLYQGRMNAQVK